MLLMPSLSPYSPSQGSASFNLYLMHPPHATTARIYLGTMTVSNIFAVMGCAGFVALETGVPVATRGFACTATLGLTILRQKTVMKDEIVSLCFELGKHKHRAPCFA